MPLYNVHIYREMRLYFPAITADTSEHAASIAADKPTAEAEYTEDCDGENLAALIDVVGDEEFTQSVTIEFEAEQLRKAAPELVGCLRSILAAFNSAASNSPGTHAIITLFGNHDDSINNAIAWRKNAHTAITKATAEQFDRRPA